LYPLQSKSGVFLSFTKFKALVENLFSSSIKQFQSDGGGEFVSNQFKNYLEANGITHHISCPHTIQQNVLAERKHCHVIKIGLSMLAQFGLSKAFWVESFLTTIFFINRLPTTVLKDRCPFSVLFNQAPDYSILRTFGYACYPLL
jgi:hypothetical protein